MKPDRSASSLFLRRLERKLVGLPIADRARVVAEVRGHIKEQSVRLGDDGSEAIAALGSPDLLGQALMEARKLPIARRLTAHTRALWRTLGAGALVSLVSLLYLMALAFIAVAVAKPFIPSHVGLWATPHQFVFGFVSRPDAPSTERLGFWLMPIAALGATTLALTGVAVSKAGRLIRLQAVDLRAH